MHKILLALLLALGDLSNSLDTEIRRDLKEISEQLAANPAAWELVTYSRVETVIENVPGLREIFDKYKIQLSNLSNNTLQEDWWLPEDSIELSEVDPSPATLVAKGFPPRSDAIDHDGEEISNITIPVRIISTAKPEETVKKLQAFKRLKDRLRLLSEE